MTIAQFTPIESQQRAAAARGSGEAAGMLRPRLDSIDLLRGLVMVLMALDHTRDFFAASSFNSRDVTDPALFLTRWITHFCAPTFILLAGISAHLYGARRRSTAEVSRFLLTRGVWLMLAEFTLVRFGWTFNLEFNHFTAQVIWVIGASMVVLALLIYLPRWAIAAIALMMIAGHNLLDGVRAEQFGALGWIWNLLHQPALLKVGPDVTLFALYPLVPWAGVMAAGYALGPLFKRDLAFRRGWLVGLGIAVTAGFVALRSTNLYGDPAVWSLHGGWLTTVLSFINCEKYPPSLLYLMMTLGPALLVLAVFEHARGALADRITIFGRVPFFYYVAHIILIHLLAVMLAWSVSGDAGWLFAPSSPHKPPGYGLNLPGVYAVWILVVLLLYPLCRWFSALKQRRSEWWWSYL